MSAVVQKLAGRTEPRPYSPRASVIVVNYNGRSHIAACLRSLITHSGDEVEIIVVDNDSSDGSADLVAADFPAVRLVRRSVNDGYGGGNNAGAALAQGEFLVILNPDTVVTAGWLDPLLAALQQDAQIGLATPKLLLTDRPGQINTAGNDVHISGLTLCRGMGQPREALAQTAVVSAVSGAAFAIRRDLFRQLGGFDAETFMYMEDTDLSLRAQLAGYRCLYVPESVVYHDYTLRFGPHKTFYQERNRYRMLLKAFRWRTLLLLLPSLLLAELVTWGFVLLRERPRWGNKLRAYAGVWRQRQDILRLRRQAQTMRRAADAELLRRLTWRLDLAQTGDGVAARLALLLLTPLFRLQRFALLGMVRW